MASRVVFFEQIWSFHVEDLQGYILPDKLYNVLIDYLIILVSKSLSVFDF